MPESKKTTDHDEIKHWVEARGAAPARVKSTATADDVGLLRINFPRESEDNLEEISWDEFFREFDEKGLEFVYQDKTAEGTVSRFGRIVYDKVQE